MMGFKISGVQTPTFRQFLTCAKLENSDDAQELELSKSPPLATQTMTSQSVGSGWWDYTAQNLAKLCTRFQNYWRQLGPEKSKKSKLLFFPPFEEEKALRDKTRSPEKRADFPKSSIKHLPIQGNYKWDRGVSFFDTQLRVHDFHQFGDLNRHRAFWLEKDNGEIVGLLRRERFSHLLGRKAPKRFYNLELVLTDNAKSSPVLNSIQAYMVEEAIRQAKRGGIRLMGRPKNEEAREIYREKGFLPLQVSLNRYVPRGEVNPIPQDMTDWLAFDECQDN